MRLNNKVAIITGAGSGIGRGCAIAFALEGAVVVVVGNVLAALNETVSEIVGNGSKALAIEVDVADADQVSAMVEEVVARFGRIDIVVSNAGIGGRKLGDGPIHECTLEGWDTIMNVNLRGTFLVCKYTLPELLKTKGNIITMSSVLGLVGTQGLYDTHAYMTSKAAIIGLTRNIATYYAKFGVRANALAPGLIDTVMASRTKTDPQLLEQIGFWQPLGAIGAIDDVAAATVFLASDEAKFITGVVLPIDGGWAAQ